MYIGTTKIMQVDAKHGDVGIPNILLTAGIKIVVKGAVFVVGRRIKRIIAFGDAIDIFAITPFQ
jgi:hypothetical protein